MSEHEHSHTEDRSISATQDGQFAPGVELLSRALKTIFVILAAVIILILLWFLTCGGSFIVDSTKEEVIVLRFGKFVEGSVYKSGWHWFLPYPVNKVVRIPIIKQEVVSRSFMASNVNKLYNPNDASQDMVAGDSLTPGKDGYTLLGDNSIMHSDWKMTYRVTDSRQYFLNCMSRETAVGGTDGPDSETVNLKTSSIMLKNLLDDAVITVSAGLDVQKTYFDKASYESLVRRQLEKNIEKANLGVTLESLNMLLVAPPIKSFDAFQMLVLSSAEREAVLEQARKFAVEQQNQALADRSKIQSDAEAYKKRVVSAVRADVEYFEEIRKQFRQNPDAAFVSLYYGILANSMISVKDKFVIGAPAGFQNQTLWLKLNPESDVKRPPKKDENNPAGEQ